jgi:hypothetical protein
VARVPTSASPALIFWTTGLTQILRVLFWLSAILFELGRFAIKSTPVFCLTESIKFSSRKQWLSVEFSFRILSRFVKA